MSEQQTNPYDTLPNLLETDTPEMAAKILAAGLELFAQKGYAATSVREIVSRAGVTNPMLYYYFQSKEGLFNELVEYLFRAVAELVDEELEGAETIKEKLEAIAWAQIGSASDSPIVLKFVYGLLLGPAESRPEVDIYDLHIELIGRVDSIIGEAIASGALAPPDSFDSLFLTNQFMGSINQHLMGALTVAESIEDDALREECLGEFLSKKESERLVQFFMAAAGDYPGR